MKYQVIDSDDYAASGVKAFFFSGGEPHVQIPAITEDTLLFLKLRTWNDVGLAVMLFDAIYHQLKDKEPSEYTPKIVAFIPYFPGARQDRSDGHTPITKEVIGAMLAYSDIPVHVFDLHSDTPMIQDPVNWMPSDVESLVLMLPAYDAVIAPDRGAIKRAEDFRSALCIPELIVAEKVREFGTGDITHYSIPNLEPGKRYLVVDDICDGGATFNLLAENVPHGVELDLWVSHGIFSKGVGNISARYNTIYTTDSFYPGELNWLQEDPRVKTLQLRSLFNKIMRS